jgi:hypothetical protein
MRRVYVAFGLAIMFFTFSVVFYVMNRSSVRTPAADPISIPTAVAEMQPATAQIVVPTHNSQTPESTKSSEQATLETGFSQRIDASLTITPTPLPECQLQDVILGAGKTINITINSPKVFWSDNSSPYPLIIMNKFMFYGKERSGDFGVNPYVQIDAMTEVARKSGIDLAVPTGTYTIGSPYQSSTSNRTIYICPPML